MEKISENQNIHNMMKYNQPVGRLRDRAPSLLAGRFELERRRYIQWKKHLPALTKSFRFRLANGSVTWKFIRGIEILFCRRIESKAFQTYLLVSLRIPHDAVIHTLSSTY